MKIFLNGDAQEIDRTDLSVSDIMLSEGVKSPETVTVQLNEEYLPSEQFISKKLKDGDSIDFVYFMGGGR